MQRRTIGRRGDYFFATVIPSHDTALQQKLIQHYHEACGHLSGLATFHLLRDKYFWSRAMRAQCLRLGNHQVTNVHYYTACKVVNYRVILTQLVTF